MPPLKENSNNNVSATKPASPSPTEWYTLSKGKDSSSLDKVYSNRLFPAKVLQNLNNLRQNSRFCDVSIVAGGNVMKVSVKLELNPLSVSYFLQVPSLNILGRLS